jgi:hypothetical protein
MKQVVIVGKDRADAFSTLLRSGRGKLTPRSLLDAITSDHDRIAMDHDVTWGQTVMEKLKRGDHVVMLIEALAENKMRSGDRNPEDVRREVVGDLRIVWRNNRHKATSRMWDAVLTSQERALGLS